MLEAEALAVLPEKYRVDRRLARRYSPQGQSGSSSTLARRAFVEQASHIDLFIFTPTLRNAIETYEDTITSGLIGGQGALSLTFGILHTRRYARRNASRHLCATPGWSITGAQKAGLNFAGRRPAMISLVTETIRASG